MARAANTPGAELRRSIWVFLRNSWRRERLSQTRVYGSKIKSCTRNVSEVLPKVLHFCGARTGLGGSSRYVEIIMSSGLKLSYDFSRLDCWWPPRRLNLGAIVKAVHILRTTRPALLHLHGLGFAAFHIAVAAKLVRQRTLLTIHSYTEDEFFRKKLEQFILAQICDKFTLRAANAAHCVSRYAAQKAVFKRCVASDLGHIDNAVPPFELPENNLRLREEFGFKPDDVLAICVSRLIREKGIQDLIAAFHCLAGRGLTQPRLLIVGDGAHARAFEAAAESLIQSGQVVMAGRRSDVLPLLGIADFFVLPSLGENQSLAILEAMVAGKAVVATRVGGTPELVADGRTGILVSPGAPVEMADAVAALAFSAEVRQRLGSDGRARALRCFSISRFMERVDAAYQTTLAMQGRSMNPQPCVCASH